MKYDAFISYSHAADGRLAPALQQALHRIAKPLNRLNALNVFRDATDLSATPHLWERIEKALQASDYLILLASPTASKSKWVKKELDFWLRHKSIDQLLIVLTEGHIEWDDERQDFNWAMTDALPLQLKGQFKMEPLYVDFKNEKTIDDLSLNNPVFKNKAAKVAAAIHQKTVSQLIGEDVRILRRNIRLRNAAIGLFGILFLGVIGLAWLSNSNAEAEKAQRKLTEAALIEAYQNQIGVLSRDRDKILNLKELATLAQRFQDTTEYTLDSDSLRLEIDRLQENIQAIKKRN